MNAAALDLAFAALADPTRRAIVRKLASGEQTVGDLAAPFRISLPAISRHLRVLERASMIRQERRGQFRSCSLNADGLQMAAQWLDFYRRFWNESFDRLDDHLTTTAKPEGASHAKNRKPRRL